MPKIVGEAADPSDGRVALVRRCAEKIEPDRDNLKEWLRSYAHNHCERIAFDLDIVERYAKKDDSVLELGSIPLILTVALVNIGYDVKGVDIDPSRFSSTIKELDLTVYARNIETEQLPFSDGSFDVVLFNEIFEHLRINPIFTLSEVRRVLRAGGRLLLSTPNLRSFRGITNFLLKNRSYSCSGNLYDEYEKLVRLGHMGHVREYTTAEVIEFLTRIGFRIETLIFRGTFQESLARAATRLVPQLRPFVTYVARAH